MPQYTTGEIAKLCDVSVRTVQFYDTKNLLKPAELTEGGRRLYTEDDLKKLQLICLLKSLGLSLDSIKGILESEHPEKVLQLLLEEQKKLLDDDIAKSQKQLKAIDIVKENILNTNSIPVETISDIELMMKNITSKKKLRKVYGIMLAVGIVMDIIQIYSLYLWIFKGIWMPFAIGMPVVILMATLSVRMYHKKVSYICPECNMVFQPSMRNFFFARHTRKTRKLECPSCEKTSFCVECIHE